jgi:hypothetical protein
MDKQEEKVIINKWIVFTTYKASTAKYLFFNSTMLLLD